MDDLFRFITIRGAQSADVGVTIQLVGSSGTTRFQDDLRQLRGPGGFRPMQAAARRYQLAPESGYVRSLAELGHAPMLARFGDALPTLMAGRVPARRPRGGGTTPGPAVSPGPLALLAELVESIFGQTAAALVADGTFRFEVDRVHDSIVSLFLAPTNVPVVIDAPRPEGQPPAAVRGPGGPSLIAPLTEVARMMDLIARVARSDAALDQPGAVAEAMARTLLLPPSVFPIDPSPRLRPAGVADLLVVREHLKGYRAGEVSDIQNLLAGESRSRTTRHTLTVETTTTAETEKTTEKATDLRTTERFELKREVETTLKEDLSVKAGVDTSAKLGTNLEISANVGVAYSTARQDAQKSASDFAREVVTRAASKVTERIKTQEINRTVETFVDEEEHGFDNSTGTAPVRGVYQWIDKISTAQIFNYGKRLLFDLTVPEPAAFLLDGAAARRDAPVAPPAFTADDTPAGRPIRAGELSPDPRPADPALRYYGRYVQRYGVTNVMAPPPERVVMSRSIVAKEPDTDFKKNLILMGENEITIPDGYYLSGMRLRGTVTPKDENASAGLTLFVGRYSVGLGDGRYRMTPPPSVYGIAPVTAMPPPGAPPTDVLVGEIPEADAPIGTVAIALSTYGLTDCALNLELLCKRTSSALAKWQLETHSAIVQGYQRAFGEYLDQLAAFTSFAPQARRLPGGSPDENRAIERRELRKAAVTLLTGRDLVRQPLGAITEHGNPGERRFPSVDVAAAAPNGAYVRFFEEAFEWEQMTYFFYPYFWGRTSTWYSKAVAQHDDPLFLEFLKAGEARVVVPVRPGFEADVWYYLMTGVIWGGGDLPHIGDRDYLPIVEEMKAIQGAPGDEVPMGAPWDVVLPTRLVRLRDDGKLPAWKREGDWTWVDDPTAAI